MCNSSLRTTHILKYSYIFNVCQCKLFWKHVTAVTLLIDQIWVAQMWGYATLPESGAPSQPIHIYVRLLDFSVYFWMLIDQIWTAQMWGLRTSERATLPIHIFSRLLHILGFLGEIFWISLWFFFSQISLFIFFGCWFIRFELRRWVGRVAYQRAGHPPHSYIGPPHSMAHTPNKVIDASGLYRHFWTPLKCGKHLNLIQ